MNKLVPFSMIIALVVGVAVLSFPAGASAQAITPVAAAPSEPSESERRAIERVIRAQLVAFQDDDAAGAFAYATPRLRAKYGSADLFMHVVRYGYAPLYRMSQAVFGPLVLTRHGAMQTVKVVAADGRPFVAMYLLQRQPDRGWAIAGMVVTAVGNREA